MKTTDIYPFFLMICGANLFGLLIYGLVFKDNIILTSSTGKLVDETTRSRNSNPSELIDLIKEMNEKLNVHINEQEQQQHNIGASSIRKKDTKRIIEKSSSSNSVYNIQPNSCQSSLVSEFDNIYKVGRWEGTLLKVNEYYNNAKWPPKFINSASGGGSNRGIATENSMEFIRKIINEYNIKSMIDLPCGDVNWIFDSYETDNLLKLYIGLDIVKDVIENNKIRYQHHNNKLFFHWDGSNCPLPKYMDTTDSNNNEYYTAVDMIHTRDVIQHLPLKDGILFICNVLQSGVKYFMTTTFPNETSNKEITQGHWYFNNLDLPPFNIPKSNICITTHPTIELDQTCLYDLTQSWTTQWIKEHC